MGTNLSRKRNYLGFVVMLGVHRWLVGLPEIGGHPFQQ